MRRGPSSGRFLPHAARETAPLFHEDELTRAARILSKAARDVAKAKRAAYVRKHCAAILASMGPSRGPDA
jgi:hypothetical protein